MTISREEAVEQIKKALSDKKESDEEITKQWVLGCCGVGGFKGLYVLDARSIVYYTVRRLLHSPTCMVITTNQQEQAIDILEDQGWQRHGPSWLNTRSGNTCQMWMISKDQFEIRWKLEPGWQTSMKDRVPEPEYRAPPPPYVQIHPVVPPPPAAYFERLPTEALGLGNPGQQIRWIYR